VAQIRRKSPCPCGSGKKYKNCCIANAPAAPVAPVAELARAREQTSPEPLEDDLDALSNSIVDLIDHKRLDEALAACDRLHRDYPEVIDWLERYAMVHEARGEWPVAADYYRRALAFTQQPEQRDGFDEDGRAYYRRKIAETEARAAAR
jgi:tetratricopeptide (TPR) repeat protein